MSFETEYSDLIIRQYWDKPKAKAEIELQASSWGRIFEWLKSFETEMDVDLATGNRLDIIGKIVGLSRLVPFAGGSPSRLLADDEYRFFLQVKIAKNSGSAFMVSDTATSIQSVVNTLFDGAAYVIDRKDMSLVLYIPKDTDLDLLSEALRLDLMPKPQGVRYSEIVQAEYGDTFGFASNPNSKGFANKFDLANEPGGKFATKVFL